MGYNQTFTVCEEEEITKTREVCTYTYDDKEEENPCSTVQRREGETKERSMTFIGCEESGYGSPGNGYGAHQVCGEKSATQKFSLPEVDEPLEQTCKLSYP